MTPYSLVDRIKHWRPPPPSSGRKMAAEPTILELTT